MGRRLWRKARGCRRFADHQPATFGVYMPPRSALLCLLPQHAKPSLPPPKPQTRQLHAPTGLLSTPFERPFPTPPPLLLVLLPLHWHPFSVDNDQTLPLTSPSTFSCTSPPAALAPLQRVQRPNTAVLQLMHVPGGLDCRLPCRLRHSSPGAQGAACRGGRHSPAARYHLDVLIASPADVQDERHCAIGVHPRQSRQQPAARPPQQTLQDCAKTQNLQTDP